MPGDSRDTCNPTGQGLGAPCPKAWRSLWEGLRGVKTRLRVWQGSPPARLHCLPLPPAPSVGLCWWPLRPLPPAPPVPVWRPWPSSRWDSHFPRWP